MTSIDMQWWATVLTGSTDTLKTTEVASAEEQYSVLPRPGDPRVIVDHGSSRAMSDAVSGWFRLEHRTRSCVVSPLDLRHLHSVASLTGEWRELSSERSANTCPKFSIDRSNCPYRLARRGRTVSLSCVVTTGTR